MYVSIYLSIYLSLLFRSNKITNATTPSFPIRPLPRSQPIHSFHYFFSLFISLLRSSCYFIQFQFRLFSLLHLLSIPFPSRPLFTLGRFSQLSVPTSSPLCTRAWRCCHSSRQQPSSSFIPSQLYPLSVHCFFAPPTGQSVNLHFLWTL